MKTSINVSCRNANITASSYNRVDVELDDVDISELASNGEIIAAIDIEAFFDANNEDDIRKYVEKNYDWFDKED